MSHKTLQALFLLFVAASCSRQPDEVWDDTKSCGRHISRGFKTLAGRPVCSRQIHNKDEFIQWNEPALCEGYYQESDFYAIPDSGCSNEVAMADYVNSQPRVTPGDYNSSIPGIQSFRDPAAVAGLRGIFRNICFEYNSNLVKGRENNEILEAVTNYMQSYPNTYLFVEGHCDERGPEAYNLALGTRRSNAVRNALVQQGVNPDHIFTISYGTERPLVMESNEEAWSKNRRVEFKIYQQ
ncbi:MAG: OmpA family protein [Parachlamydiaceae bacterium]|nr:OmpA family protein [Parachlamydiaceae bacterium]